MDLREVLLRRSQRRRSFDVTVELEELSPACFIVDHIWAVRHRDESGSTASSGGIEGEHHACGPRGYLFRRVCGYVVSSSHSALQLKTKVS